MPHASDQSLDVMFHNARTYTAWQDKSVDQDLLKKIHDLFILGPTSANMLPARITYIISDDAKEKLKPCLDAGNVKQTMSAPVTAIIAMDMEFYEKLPKTYPHTDAKSWFDQKSEEELYPVALRNSSLQGAYFMLAARALGLDCGPMSGFDNDKVDQTFFAGTSIKSNFLCNLGYGDVSKLHPRSPRLSFDEITKIL